MLPNRATDAVILELRPELRDLRNLCADLWRVCSQRAIAAQETEWSDRGLIAQHDVFFCRINPDIQILSTPRYSVHRERVRANDQKSRIGIIQCSQQIKPIIVHDRRIIRTGISARAYVGTSFPVSSHIRRDSTST